MENNIVIEHKDSILISFDYAIFYISINSNSKGEIIMAKEITRKVDTGIIQRGKTYRFTAYLGYDRNGKQIRKITHLHHPKD